MGEKETEEIGDDVTGPNGKQRQIDQIMTRFDQLDERVGKVHDCVLLLDNERLPERLRALETARVQADTRAAVVKAVGTVVIKAVAVVSAISGTAYTIIKVASDLTR